MSLHKPCAALSLVTNLIVQRKGKKKPVFPFHVQESLYIEMTVQEPDIPLMKASSNRKGFCSHNHCFFLEWCSSKFQQAPIHVYRFRLSSFHCGAYTLFSLGISSSNNGETSLFPTERPSISALSHLLKTSIFFLTPHFTLSAPHRPLRSNPQS